VLALLSVAVAVTVDIEVHGGADRVAVEWLGKPMEQDHSPARFEGDPVRFLPVRVEVDGQVYESVEPMPAGDTTLHYAAGHRGLRRVSGPGGVEAVAQRERRAPLLSCGVAAALLLGVLAMHRGRPREGWWDRRLSPLLWLALAIAWTWPAALGQPTGLHFDTLGTLWSIDAAPRLLQSLTDPLTGYPAGADYSAFDSYLMLPVAALLAPLGAARIHGLLAVLGVAVSAWAAEAFARSLGARGPFALIAGFAFAFSGIAANALLEGHVYHVVDPWLPLFALAWWKATQPGGSWKHAVWAGLAFNAALLTSGYIGMACAVIAVGFWLGGRKKPGLAALPVVLPVIAAVGAMVAGASPEVTDASVRVGSGSLRALAGPSAELDRYQHSMTLALDGVVLALLVLGKGPARLRWTAVAALALTFVGLPSDFLRFPARMAWTFGLCGGAFAAVAASQLGRGAIALVPASAAWAFAVVALPWRQGTLPIERPDLTGSTLELLPGGQNPNGDLDAWFSASACWGQTGHRQPLAEDCVTMPVTANPRALLGEALVAALHGRAEPPDVSAYDAVSTRPDLLRPADRALLEARWGPPQERVTGGERFWSWTPPLAWLEATSQTSELTVLAHDDTSRQLEVDGRPVAQLEFQPIGRQHAAVFGGALKGPVRLDGEPVLVLGEVLVLDADGQPTLATPEHFSPVVEDGRERATRLGWGLWVTVAAGCLVARRML